LIVAVVIVAVVAPASGASSSKTARCGGHVRSGKRAACNASIYIPHFNSRDAIDFSSLVARIESPNAESWRVTGTLADTKGVVYFAWYCSAARSSVSGRNQTHVGYSCGAWRKMVNVRRNGRTYPTYYTADTSRPQRLHVTAQVRRCIGNPLRGCRFTAKAVYRLS
jgi:hypothetical protein